MVTEDADENTESTVATLALGLLVGVVLAALVLGGWYVTSPPQPGLRWGDAVYTSEDEFKAYLRDKGLSYPAWAARHPGAAPWGR
jgi:hypothetical protein